MGVGPFWLDILLVHLACHTARSVWPDMGVDHFWSLAWHTTRSVWPDMLLIPFGLTYY